ncbi:MAG: SIS domain-containing protein [Thermoproteota archaeon]
MIREIRDTPRALSKVLEIEGVLRKTAEELFATGVKRLIFTGCGSSYYAALAAVRASSATFSLQALPSSEFLFYQSEIDLKKTAVVGISRSGRTAETLAALRKGKARGITTVAITCSECSPMESEADISIVLNIGEEKSLIMTKTFSSLSLASILLCSKFHKEYCDISKKRMLESLPEAATEALKLEEDIVRIAENVYSKGFFFVLGHGSAYPVALEGALKLMETCDLKACALHTLEFRHGPMSVVDDTVGLIVIALEDCSLQAVARLINDMKREGFKPLLISNVIKNRYTLKLPMRLDPKLSAPVVILPIQLLAFYISIRRGFNPDSPRRLHRFVRGF